jgi:hypothetical protein
MLESKVLTRSLFALVFVISSSAIALSQDRTRFELIGSLSPKGTVSEITHPRIGGNGGEWRAKYVEAWVPGQNRPLPKHLYNRAPVGTEVWVWKSMLKSRAYPVFSGETWQDLAGNFTNGNAKFLARFNSQPLAAVNAPISITPVYIPPTWTAKLVKPQPPVTSVTFSSPAAARESEEFSLLVLNATPSLVIAFAALLGLGIYSHVREPKFKQITADMRLSLRACNGGKDLAAEQLSIRYIPLLSAISLSFNKGVYSPLLLSFIHTSWPDKFGDIGISINTEYSSCAGYKFIVTAKFKNLSAWRTRSWSEWSATRETIESWGKDFIPELELTHNKQGLKPQVEIRPPVVDPEQGRVVIPVRPLNGYKFANDLDEEIETIITDLNDARFSFDSLTQEGEFTNIRINYIAEGANHGREINQSAYA